MTHRSRWNLWTQVNLNTTNWNFIPDKLNERIKIFVFSLIFDQGDSKSFPTYLTFAWDRPFYQILSLDFFYVYKLFKNGIMRLFKTLNQSYNDWLYSINTIPTPWLQYWALKTGNEHIFLLVKDLLTMPKVREIIIKNIWRYFEIMVSKSLVDNF